MSEPLKIIILKSGKDGVAFRPDVTGVKRGAPLQAQKGDFVSWVNRTKWNLTLEAIGKTAGLFEIKIPAGDSTWFFLIDQCIEYRCKKPPAEHKIKV